MTDEPTEPNKPTRAAIRTAELAECGARIEALLLEYGAAISFVETKRIRNGAHVYTTGVEIVDAGT